MKIQILIKTFKIKLIYTFSMSLPYMTISQSFPYSIGSYSYYSKELFLLKGAFLFSTLGAF
ncbi:unnamed protein product [marine sediment metagenome]|uniref:Uncharacterized protein n=1 Tax=marine sediment metagenome TaxID=412755 RepID=X1PQT8_9ZZZZ